MIASNFNVIMKEEATKFTGKTEKEPPVLSKDQGIKQLEDRKKELSKKENRPEREKVEYTELNNTMKKKRRLRSRKKRTDHAETILQSSRGPKHIYKRGPKEKICGMEK